MVALVTLLGYEWHAWRKGPEPTISAIVRIWDRPLLRRVLVFASVTLVAWSIQFLAVHFVWNVG